MRTYLVATVAAFALLSPPLAHAEPITYTLTFDRVDIGIGQQIFRDGSITLTLAGDTRNVTDAFNRFGPYYVFTSATVSYAIAGGPSGTALYGARITYEGYSGIFRVDTDVVGSGSSSFARTAINPPPFLNYGLKTTYTGGSTYLEIPAGGIALPTGSGIGVFDTPNSTFLFRSAVTPEPSSIVMAAAGLVGVGLFRYRRAHDHQIRRLRPRLRP